MATREHCSKRKSDIVALRSHQMKIQRTSSADTGLQQATEMASVASVASILKTESNGHISQEILDSCLLLSAKTCQRRILQLLLQNGANVNTKDINGYTPLMISAKHGFSDLVRSLVKRGADVRVRDKAGKTAFLLGVEHACSLSLLDIFLSDVVNADVNDQDENGKTALMLSVECWNIDAMEMLIGINETNLDLKDQQGRTAYQIAHKCGLGDLFTLFIECHRTNKTCQQPLNLAVQRKDCDLVRLMLDCDYSKINESDFTPLMAAFSSSSSEENEKISVNLEIVEMLIKAGANVNQKTENWTPLMLAARAGNVEGVKLLVENGAHVNQKTYFYEETALMIASKYGRVDVVAFLISNKADVTSKDRRESTALKYALENSNSKCAQLLLNSGIPTDKSVFILALQTGQHRLFPNVDRNLASRDLLDQFYTDAIKAGNHDLVTYLLDNGVDVHVHDEDHTPPLVLAVGSKDKVMVKVLIERGIYLDDQDEDTGHTALTKASSLNDKEIVQTLVTHGAEMSITLSGTLNHTALVIAVKHEFMDIVKILLNAGAEVNDHFGGALHTAVKRCNKNVYKLARMLLDHGAEVDSLNDNGETPLIACKDKNTQSLLLRRGANINAQSYPGRSLLLNSIKNDASVKRVKWLLENGADINQSNHRSITPLMEAAYGTNVAMVQMLIDNGAEVNYFQRYRSPLHACLETSYRHRFGQTSTADILKILIDNGADLNVQNIDEKTPLMVISSTGYSDLLKSVLDGGADVNMVTGSKYDPDCALSVALKNHPHHDVVLKCLEMLLHYGARMNEGCMSEIVVAKFHILITYNRNDLIQLLVKSGIYPDVTKSHILKYAAFGLDYPFSAYKLYFLSPLCTALFCGNLGLAKLFLESWFLTESDLYIFNDTNVVKCLQYGEKKESLSFLKDMGSKPCSLAMMSFIAVSENIGFDCGREAKIRSLPIPHTIQEKLLYRI